MTKLAGYLLLAVLATALWKCKDEDNNGAQPFGAPKSEIIISGGLTTFNYGDTLFIDAHTTENDKYVYQMKLYFDGEELLSTIEKGFTYEIYTLGLEAGQHTVKVTALDNRDSLGVTVSTIELVAHAPEIGSVDVLQVEGGSAVFYGRLASTGGNSTHWGVCYNSTGMPDIGDNTMEATDCTFSIKITGLEKLSTYYARAWATNAVGTSYGKTIEFKTTDETGTFTDFRDDHEYRWVKIGDQVWMAENLAYLPFLSDPLNNPAKDSNIWVYGYGGMDISEAKQTDNYKTYGALYSFSMANKYCPAGWHLPDTAEWNELIGFLGGSEVAGGKMKEKGTGHWNEPNEGATNESGFTALPGGDFLPYLGLGNYINERSYFWYSIESNPEKEYIDAKYILSYKLNEIGLTGSNIGKVYGHSVRCVKN